MSALSVSSGIPAFFVAFIITPFASNASEVWGRGPEGVGEEERGWGWGRAREVGGGVGERGRGWGRGRERDRFDSAPRGT